jgi:hypothetical protein
MPTELEKQWMAAWRRAGPELERIRNEELCVRDDRIGMKLLGAAQTPPQSAQSGLIAFQAWMMRLHVKLLMKTQ